VVGAVIYAQWAVGGGALAVDCRWLRWTGLPCPGCGATRCLAACGRLDLAAAWQWHPLVTSLALAFLCWPVFVLAGRGFDLAWPGRMLTWLGRMLTPRRMLAVLAVHWLYLCWMWPR
jgi:hypothetical protein